MTLPVLPMGTIMAACMLLTAFAVAAVGPGTPRVAVRTALAGAAAVSLAAGLWQLGWYFPRHPVDRWGLTALLSGALLVAGGAWCASRRVRAVAPAARWPLAAALGGLALLYAVTIARL